MLVVMVETSPLPATPGQAIARGADYLVVGRQILSAEDPKAMAEQVQAEIAATL